MTDAAVPNRTPKLAPTALTLGLSDDTGGHCPPVLLEEESAVGVVGMELIVEVAELAASVDKVLLAVEAEATTDSFSKPGCQEW